MVSIFDGEVDYQTFLENLLYKQMAADGLDVRNMDTSLEWIGNQCKGTLNHNRYKIQRLEQQHELVGQAEQIVA